MNHIDMSKITFNPLITLLFTGAMWTQQKLTFLAKEAEDEKEASSGKDVGDDRSLDISYM